MKDFRCILLRHRWQRRRAEDSVYYECTRCHDIRGSYDVPPAVTMWGLVGTESRSRSDSRAGTTPSAAPAGHATPVERVFWPDTPPSERRSRQRVTLIVHGEPIAHIVPHGRRPRWVSGESTNDELSPPALSPRAPDPPATAIAHSLPVVTQDADVDRAGHSRMSANVSTTRHGGQTAQVAAVPPAGFEPATRGLGNRCSLP